MKTRVDHQVASLTAKIEALTDHLTRLAQIAEMQMQATADLLRVMGVEVDPHPDAEPDRAQEPLTREERIERDLLLGDPINAGTQNSEEVIAAEDNIDPFDEMRAELAEDEDEPPPEPDEADLWRRRLGMWRENRIWAPGWGPRPGQEGCRVPYEMMGGGR
jgi:hypothetical protein